MATTTREMIDEARAELRESRVGYRRNEVFYLQRTLAVVLDVLEALEAREVS